MPASIIELKSLPPAFSTFVNAARTATRKPGEPIELPLLQAHVPAVRIETARLQAYSELLGFPESDALPLTYPHVLGSSLQMFLMAQPQFPLPMLGLVHLRNTIEQVRPLRADETFDLHVELSESRDTTLGLEFDFLTEFSVDDEILWRGVSSYLYRISGKPRQRSGVPAAEPIPLSKYVALDAPADIGRRYAKVSRDYNPIHLYALTAKLFGFKRAIATGMWTAARALALLQQELGIAPQKYEFQFRQPYLLPGRGALRYETARGKTDFALVGADAGKIHLLGTLR